MEELQMIADLCKKYNVICISDEVYEWLVYGGVHHIRIGTKCLKYFQRCGCYWSCLITYTTANLGGLTFRTNRNSLRKEISQFVE